MKIMEQEEIQEMQEQNRRLNNELLQLWCFLQSEDLWEEARDYLEDHKDDELPFEAKWIF